MAAMLRLHLLGDARVLLDGEPVTGFISNKALALFCYLAVNGGREHHRANLATLFWGEAAEEDAATSLRQALANLRRLLGPYVIAGRQTVVFNRAASHWIDSAAFVAALAPPAVDRAEASALYAGPFLDRLIVREAPDFDTWVDAERLRLHTLAIDALRELVAMALVGGEWDTGIRHARRLLELDPWREETHRDLMLLLARAGQRSAALAQFVTCRRALAEELGIEPTPETTALYERLRAASSHAARLPTPATPLLGRADELAAIDAALTDPACRLLTIAGPGGIGKTRLALEVAARLVSSGRFLNGVAFVPLVGIGTSAALIAAIAEGCGLTLAGRAAPEAQLLDYLRGKEAALVLDNAEGLPGVAALATAILRAAPDVKLLVTSRERLRLGAERVYPLAGLAYPPAPPTADDDTAELATYSAVRLFAECARRVRPDLALGLPDYRGIARVCRLLGGLPLGIELAAAWAAALPPATIADEIARSFDFLAARDRDLPERQRSLRSVFASSWRRLGEAERAVYRRLAVFRGGFALDAAFAVAGATPPILAALIDRSLLRREGERYELHEVLRQYAAEALAATDEEPQLRARHAAHYTALATDRGPQLTGTAQLAAAEELARELGNLTDAWRWALAEGESASIGALAFPLFRFFSLHSRYQEGDALFAEAADAPAIADDRVLQARVLAIRGAFSFRLDRYTEARELCERGLALIDTGADPALPERILCHHTLGNLTWNSGDYGGAEVWYRRALPLAEAAGDIHLVAQTLNRLGVTRRELGGFDEARGFFEAALRHNRRIGNRQATAIVLENLGGLLADHGEAETARAYRLEALALFRALGDRLEESRTLNNLGYSSYERGALDEAAEYLHASLAISRDIGNRVLSALALGNLGLVEGCRGDFAAAHRYLRASIGGSWALRADQWGISGVAALAEVLARQGAAEAALELVGLVLAQPTANVETQDRCRAVIARLAERLSPERSAAARERGRSLELAETIEAILDGAGRWT